jgi:LacI family transcriptional regulator
MTAVACTTDAHAIGAILEAARMNIDVPGRLSVTGFDDLALASQLTPALTTVHVPARDLGRYTADFVIAAIQGRVGPTSVDLPVDLILRSSHGPPPATVG